MVSRHSAAESSATQLAVTDMHGSKRTRASVFLPPPPAMARWTAAAITAPPICLAGSDGEVMAAAARSGKHAGLGIIAELTMYHSGHARLRGRLPEYVRPFYQLSAAARAGCGGVRSSAMRPIRAGDTRWQRMILTAACSGWRFCRRLEDRRRTHRACEASHPEPGALCSQWQLHHLALPGVQPAKTLPAI